MKIAVVTYGTEGDARPLAALCRALMDAGHETRLLADAATLSSAVSLGVPSTALAGNIRQALSNSVNIHGGFNNTSKALAEIANANTAAWMREAADVSDGCDAIIASGLAAFAGLSVAEYRGIPAIGTGLFPITPTAAFPSPFLPPGMIPRWANRISHRFIIAMLWQAFRKSTNAARKNVLGLPARKSVWSEHPMLYGISPSLLPEPADWPKHARVCGQWSLAAPDWAPPPALADFLAAGDPPIYAGFGSMTAFDGRQLMEAIVKAIAGRRALFYPGWSGADTSLLPKNFFVVGETAHQWLFPKTSLVIHHGGSGTTHSVARAGVPSVVIPFAGDQPFWADRLQRLGIAGKPVNGKRIQSEALKQGIAFAEREDVRSRAAQVRMAMAREDGLSKAVEIIENLTAKTAHARTEPA